MWRYSHQQPLHSNCRPLRYKLKIATTVSGKRKYVSNSLNAIIFYISSAGVRIGDHDYKTSVDCETSAFGVKVCAPPFQDLAIEDVLPHPQFNLNTTGNDIALLRLARSVDLSSLGG